MISSRPRLALVAVLAAVALGATACTSTTDGTLAGRASGSGSPAPSGSGPDFESPLSSLVLTAADLPSDWESSGGTSTGGSPTDDTDLASCFGQASASGTTSLDSPEFDKDSDDGSAEITSSVTRYASDADMQSDLALFTGSKAATCFAEYLDKTVKSDVPAGATAGKTHASVTHGSGNGPSNVKAVLGFTVTLTATGVSVTVTASITFITGPRLLAELTTISVPTTFPDDVLSAAISKLAGRLAKG